MKRNSRLFLPVIAFIFLFLFIGRYAYININTLEDSIWLKPAIDISRGSILFRDTFSPYGMVVPLMQGLTVKIFGPYLLPLRLEAAFFYAITGIILFYLWSRYMTKSISLASVALWLAMAPFYDDMLLPWSSIYALVFQGLAFFFLTLFAEKRKEWHMFWAGVFILLTVLTRQPVGVCLAIAAVIYLIFAVLSRQIRPKQAVRSFLYLFTGMCVAFLPFYLYLIFNKALKDWWIQSFVFAKEYAKVIRGISMEQLIKSLLLGRYYKMGQYHLMLIWLAIPLSMFYFLTKPVVMLIRKKKIAPGTEKLFLAAIICLGSWMQYYPMTEPTHFFWAVTPTIGFFTLAMFQIFLPARKPLRSLATMSLLGLSIALIMLRVFAGMSRFINASAYSSTMPFLKGIKISTYEDRKINTFYSTLTSHLSRQDTFINISDDAMVPLLDSRFHQIPPLYEQWNFFAERLYPEYYDKVYAYILKSRPLIVTRTLPYLINYCALKNIDYPQQYMGIHIPAERVIDVRLDGGFLTVVPAKNTELIDIRQLDTAIKSFTVPDLKKLRLTSVADKESLPVSLNKGDEVTIKIAQFTNPIVLYFKDDDIGSCTFAVTNNNHK